MPCEHSREELTITTEDPGEHPADVELRIPADSAYLSLLRTATASLAARLDFTLDDLEDARMAAGEAASLVLEAARPGSTVTARFWVAAGELRVAVSAPADAPQPPAPDGFAWTVLTTLAREARVRTTADQVEITLVAQQGHRPAT